MNVQAEEIFANIDWLITEKIDTICICEIIRNDVKLRKLTENEFNVFVFTNQFRKKHEFIQINLPIQMNSNLGISALIPTNWKVFDLLEFIYDFYDTDVTFEELEEIKNQPHFKNDEYFERVENKIQANIPQKYFNLVNSNDIGSKDIGSKDIGSNDIGSKDIDNKLQCSLDPENRRNPFICNGMIRFEGLRFGKSFTDGKFQIDVILER